MSMAAFQPQQQMDQRSMYNNQPNNSQPRMNQHPPFQHGSNQHDRPPPFSNSQQQQHQHFGNRERRHSGGFTLKTILTRDEASYLFGFDGVLLNQLRQQTGANINITDQASVEHVLGIGGDLEIIFKAFSLVCRKLWDFLQSVSGGSGGRPLIIRLAVHQSHCGTIIGKQGAKIREIKELSGANVLVGQDSLPNSNERCVEISGSGEACVQATYHICSVMRDMPIRGEVIAYVPRLIPGQSGPLGPGNGGPGGWRPVILCGPMAYLIEGDVARPCPPEVLRMALDNGQGGGNKFQPPSEPQPQFQPNAAEPNRPSFMNPDVLMKAITDAPHSTTQTSEEMGIAPELIVAVFGPDGAKIPEIRQMSGASVHVGDENMPLNRRGERVVTLSGTRECITLAQFLIQSSLELALKERQQQLSNTPNPDIFTNAQPQQHSFGGGGGGGVMNSRDPRQRGGFGRDGGGGGDNFRNNFERNGFSAGNNGGGPPQNGGFGGQFGRR